MASDQNNVVELITHLTAHKTLSPSLSYHRDEGQNIDSYGNTGYMSSAEYDKMPPTYSNAYSS